MKRLVTATAILLALGSSAFAMAANQGLSAADASEARKYVPNGDFANLTSAQAHAIANTLHGGDENRGATIRSILLQN